MATAGVKIKNIDETEGDMKKMSGVRWLGSGCG